jgi:hypothetical protein
VLSKAALDCNRRLGLKIISEPMVKIRCETGSVPRACASEFEATSCARQALREGYAQCRANVRVFQLGREQADKVIDDAPDDLRSDIMDAYIEKLPQATDALGEIGGEFRDKVEILDRTLSLLGDGSPSNILSVGQMFAMAAFEKTEPGDLATTLFDAASSGVSTGGARAIEDAVAALEGFDGAYAADHPFKQSVGLPIGGFQPRASTNAGKGGGGQTSNGGGQQQRYVSIRCIDQRINGYVFINAPEGSSASAACRSAGYVN